MGMKGNQLAILAASFQHLKSFVVVHKHNRRRNSGHRGNNDALREKFEVIFKWLKK
jgi:hypothetical protein